MTYKAHFPDFPDAELPAIPADWHDMTCRNDCCPSWAVSELLVYTDRLKPQDREYPDCTRFAVFHLSDGMELVLETDDWAEVLRYVDDYVYDVGLDSEADRCRG